MFYKILIMLSFFLVFFLFTYFIQGFLEKKGILRDKGLVGVAVVSVVTVLLKEYFFQNIPWYLWITLTPIIMVLGLNRNEFWFTLQRGRWWWKKKK